MTAPIIQPSFAAGELSPQLYARVDLAKFHVGAAELRNMFVDFQGGVSKRAGTRYVGQAELQSPQRGRLVEFVYSQSQAYVLEFGHQIVKFIRNGGYVSGTNGSPYAIFVPYDIGDLPNLKFTQANDVLTITHPNFPIGELKRLADASWSFNYKVTRPAIIPPQSLSTAVQVTSGTASTTYQYVVTSVDGDGNESSASQVATIYTANFSSTVMTIYIGWAPIIGASFYKVYKAQPNVGSKVVSGAQYGLIGNCRGVEFADTNIVPNFSYSPPLHTSPFDPSRITSVGVTANGQNYTTNTTISITDTTGVSGAAYPIIQGGKIVSAVVTDGGGGYSNPTVTAKDDPNNNLGSGATLVATLGPTSGTYPTVSTYFGQRQYFAGTVNMPATFWATKVGEFNNFDVSSPQVDSDSLQFTIFGLQQNAIKWLIPQQNGLIALTAGASYKITGATAGAAITANSIQVTPQAYNGAADIRPVVINYDILYVQALGSTIRSLAYNFYSDSYAGEDKTFLASHLFRGRSIKAMAWAEEPHKIVWCLRDDGKLLAFTYVKEQDIYAWTLCETQGYVTSICVVPEGQTNVLYMLVERYANGATRTYVERMQERVFTGTTDAWFLDSGLRYSGAMTANVSGLGHLEGRVVQVVADGKRQGDKTVTSGAITLDAPASQVLVGLGYPSWVRSLPLDKGEPTMQGKRKKIVAVTARFVDAVGLQSGGVEAELVPMRIEVGTGGLFTGDIRTNIDKTWDAYGQVLLRSDEPFPWTLTALMPEAVVGDS